MGLGQGEGPLVLDGVLRGQHQERRGERTGDAVHRDLPFLHGLQQRGLGAGRGPVDLVGQQDVDKDRAGPELERVGLLVEHAHAGDVVGQQVGRALQPLEADAQAGGDGPGQHGLAGAGHVLDEHVSLAEQGHHQQFDLLSFADDDGFDVADDAVSELGDGSHGNLLITLLKARHACHNFLRLPAEVKHAIDHSHHISRNINQWRYPGDGFLHELAIFN